MNKELFSTTMTGYIVWTNTDLTEGRGQEIPIHVCMTLSTAKRLAKGKYVQGTDCSVTENILYRIKTGPHGFYQWFGPVRIIEPSKEDLEKESFLKEQKEKEEARKVIFEKARVLGLTDEEIKVLQNE